MNSPLLESSAWHVSGLARMKLAQLIVETMTLRQDDENLIDEGEESILQQDKSIKRRVSLSFMQAIGKR